MRLRQSFIKKFAACPAQARFSEVEGLPEPQNWKQFFGTAIHFCLEKLNLGEVDTEQAKALFMDLMQNPEKLAANPTVMPRMTTFGGLENKGLWILDGFADKYRWEDRQLVATEHSFLVPFGRHELTGTIDLIELRDNHKGKQILRVCDYKTNTRKPSFTELQVNVQFCADEQTEILTRRGWMRPVDLIVGEDVLTLDQASATAEWQPAEAINTFPTTDQLLVSMEGRGHSSLTTHSHRWPVERTSTVGHRGGWRRQNAIVTTAELRGSDRIRCAAPVTNLPATPKWDDSFVELVAWYWTGAISQSETANPQKVARIRDCLTSLYGPMTPDMRAVRAVPMARWRENRTEFKANGIVRFHLNKWSAAELREVCEGRQMLVRADFVTSLTEEQLRLFIDTSIDGDGTTRNGSRVITQSVKERLDAFQMACSLAGIRTTLTRQLLGGTGPYAGREFWRLALLERRPYVWPSARQDGFTIKEVSHTGYVWCPTTANGTWLARRNGSVYFTGNTVYSYATTQREFWVGNGADYPGLPDGEAMFEQLADVDRRSIWYHLWNGAEIDAGTRGDADFGRLYRVCNEIERAIELDVFVPDISGETCIFCPYVKPCCGVEIPSPDELIEQQAAWA